MTAKTQRWSSPDAWQGPDTYSAKFQQRRNKVNIVKDKMSQGPEEGVINSHCGEAVLSQPGRMTRILTAGEASPAEGTADAKGGLTITRPSPTAQCSILSIVRRPALPHRLASEVKATCPCYCPSRTLTKDLYV